MFRSIFYVLVQDFARKEETNAFKNHEGGNRIATVLFYVSR